MRIGLGSDRLGLQFKEFIKRGIAGQGHALRDFSEIELAEGEYRGVAAKLASAIHGGQIERGVLICAGGIGASVLANRNRRVRAALCHDMYSAKVGVEDDDMNLLVLDARVVSEELAGELVDGFLKATYVPRERPRGIPPWRLKRIVEHIHGNLDQPLAVEALSDLAEMSPSHFSKLFRASTGLAPHQFVLQARIDRAKDCLTRKKAKIVDVALSVGFENQAHFTTAFRNFVGMTPREYQRVSAIEQVDEAGGRLPVTTEAGWSQRPDARRLQSC